MEGQVIMSKVVVENIVASAQISAGYKVEQLSEKILDFKYSPDEFEGLTMKLEYPKTAILLFPSGKIICTGAKDMDEVNKSINKTVKKIKDAGFTTRKKHDVEIQNVVASTNLNKEMHLSSINKGLLLQDVQYEPDQFPGLIYKINDYGAILLLFSSGKLVCTGTKSLEDANSAINMMKEKLSSIGAL